MRVLKVNRKAALAKISTVSWCKINDGALGRILNSLFPECLIEVSDCVNDEQILYDLKIRVRSVNNGS